jgi:hypothetical protein
MDDDRSYDRARTLKSSLAVAPGSLRFGTSRFDFRLQSSDLRFLFFHRFLESVILVDFRGVNPQSIDDGSAN